MSLSETFEGLDYQKMVHNVGEIAYFFKGWSYREIMSMSPRERRHWIKWAEALIDLEKPRENG